MHPHEVKLLRQYAINEVAGGLLLGRHLLKSADPVVRSELTHHALDEFKHGWMWTEFLDKAGVGVAGAEGRNEYFEYIGTQEDDLEFLAAVHIYEIRVPFHLGVHMEHPGLSPGLKEVIGAIRDDEKFHLGWIRKYLLARMETEPERVRAAVAASEALEERTYRAYLERIKQYGEYCGEFVALIENALPSFDAPGKYFAEPAHA